MQLSVIILNYNVEHFLELCIRSVERAIADLDAEIIVADNNSQDGSCQRVLKFFPKVKLLSNQQNIGFAKANNLAVAKAKGEYVCILNPDTVVAESTFVNMLLFAKQQKRLGAIGCKLIDGSGKFLPESKRNVPTPWVSFKKVLGKSDSYYVHNIKEHETGKVSVLVGAFMFMKKEVYEEVGGFDERYFMYGEDIDLSYTLVKKGYENYYFGAEKVIHFKGESTLKDATYAKRFYGAMELFYNKYFKSHFLLTALIRLGVNLIPFIVKPKASQQEKLYDRVIAVTKNEQLIAQLNESYAEVIQASLEEFKSISLESTALVLDADVVSYKEIINLLDQYKNHDLNIKIKPNKSSFYLGSSSAISRGSVVEWSE